MKRAFTLLEALIVVAVIALVAAFLFPIFARSRGSGGPGCQSNLKQIGLGMAQYTQDYNERYPSARVAATLGWADVLQPYIKSQPIFQCPQAQSGDTTTFTSDYFYNQRLAAVTLDKVLSPQLTVIFGDGGDNAPTWSSWSGLPADATTNVGSPSQRHLEGANYCFTDGHAKWYKPDAISSTFASPTSRATFAVR